jgi:hypothetical protein
MPTDRSRTSYPAFLVPDPAFLASNLASDSSYTAVGPLPGAPVPAGSYDLALTSHGDQAASGDLTVIVQAGGVVGRGGASFLWKNTADPSYYGWDAPTVLTGWAPVLWAAAPRVGHPCVVTLYSGAAFGVWSSGTYLNSIGCTTIGGTPGSIALLGGATGAADCAPCLVQLPPTAEIPLGRLVLFVWVVDSVAQTQTIQMQFSDDDGATWSLGSTGVLPEPISTDSTGYQSTRLRAAYANGQILLMVGLKSNNVLLYPGAADPNKGFRNEVRQYASSDDGHTFTKVWASNLMLVGRSSRWDDPASQDGGGFPDVAVHDGTFYVAWLSLIDLMPYVCRLESAFQSIGSTVGVVASESEVWGTLDATSAYFSDGDCVLTVDETGVLYITGRCPTDGNRWVINYSSDFGATWPPMARSSMAGGGGLWWDAEDSGTYPADAAGCWHRGRLLVLAGHGSDPSTYDGGSLSIYALGGYSTVTMPGYDRWRADSRQVTWGQTWLPLDLPGDAGWTRTVVGTPTESLASGLLSLTVGVPQALAYGVVPGGTVAGGVIAEWAATVTSGAYRVRLRTADGASGYQITVSCSSAGFTVVDGKSGTVLATVTAAGEVWIRASITAGICSLWYRVATDPITSTRAWTQAVSAVALTDGVATWAANLIGWGHTIGSSHASTWRFFAWIDDDGLGYVGTGLGSASIPRDLLGRRFASVPTDLDGSTSISANGGPAWAGQSWRIRTAYEYGPDKLHPEISPSPQIGARLAQASNHSLIWDFHTSTTGLEGRPLALAIMASNFQGATLYGWNGAWNNIAALSNAITTGAGYVRSGRMVAVTAGGTLSYVVANQLVGASIDLGGGKVRRIAANGEGQIGGTSSVTAWMRLDGVDDTEGTSGTCTIYVPQIVMVLAQPANYSRFKLYIPACTTPEGYIKVGKVLLGSLRILPRRPSAGRSLDWMPQYETDRPKGGVRSFFRAGKPIRRARLPFSDLLPSSQVYASAKTPGYAKLSTAGAAIASYHGAAMSVLGMVDELGGSPCVYVANVNATSSNTIPVSVLDPSLILYGRILEDMSLTTQRGTEGENGAFGLSGLVVEEEP